MLEGFGIGGWSRTLSRLTYCTSRELSLGFTGLRLACFLHRDKRPSRQHPKFSLLRVDLLSVRASIQAEQKAFQASTPQMPQSRNSVFHDSEHSLLTILFLL